MARKGKEDRDNLALRGQLDLLRLGCRAASWACRELLDLHVDCTEAQVVNAVHNGIHKALKVGTGDSLHDAVAAITAGAVLLRSK